MYVEYTVQYTVVWQRLNLEMTLVRDLHTYIHPVSNANPLPNPKYRKIDIRKSVEITTVPETKLQPIVILLNIL